MPHCRILELAGLAMMAVMLVETDPDSGEPEDESQRDGTLRESQRCYPNNPVVMTSRE